MKRNHFLVYSLVLSSVSFAVALVASVSAVALRHTIHAMIGDKPLPWLTTVSLSSPPFFYLLATVFLGLGVAAVLRPTLLGSLLHACLAVLIAELSALCLAAYGMFEFFARLDYAMSP